MTKVEVVVVEEDVDEILEETDVLEIGGMVMVGTDDVVEDRAVEVEPPTQALLPHVCPGVQTSEQSSPRAHLTLGKLQQTAPVA